MNLIAEFKLTKRRSFLYNAISGAAFAAGLFAFLLYAAIQPDNSLAPNILQHHSNIIMFTFVGMVVVLHEALHALGYKLFGGKVKCGMKLFNIYTMDVSGRFYKAGEMLVIMLLPAVVLSMFLLILSFILPEYIYYIFIGLLFNISGSTGDFLMSSYLIRNGLKCMVKDNEEGFNIYLADNTDVNVGALTAVKAD